MGLNPNEQWDEQVAWMRARGVVAAEWNADGTVRAATLGPEPPPPVVPMTPEEEEALKKRLQDELDQLPYASA